MTHTPGPWEANDTDGEHHAIVSPTDESPDHFTVICIGPNAATENANARLISAAPDLLAALEDCVGILDHLLRLSPVHGYRRDIAAARAAIAKAKGE